MVCHCQPSWTTTSITTACARTLIPIISSSRHLHQYLHALPPPIPGTRAAGQYLWHCRQCQYLHTSSEGQHSKRTQASITACQAKTSTTAAIAATYHHHRWVKNLYHCFQTSISLHIFHRHNLHHCQWCRYICWLPWLLVPVLNAGPIFHHHH